MVFVNPMEYECAIWITSIVYNRVGIFTKRRHMNSTKCITQLRSRRMVAISLKDRHTDCISRYGIVSFKWRLCNTLVQSVFLSTEKPVAQNHSKGWTRNAIYDHISRMWYCAENSGKSLEYLEGKNDNIYNCITSTLWSYNNNLHGVEIFYSIPQLTWFQNGNGDTQPWFCVESRPPLISFPWTHISCRFRNTRRVCPMKNKATTPKNVCACRISKLLWFAAWCWTPVRRFYKYYPRISINMLE